MEGNKGHVVGTLRLDIGAVHQRPRILPDRRFHVLAACEFVCVFCRLALRATGVVRGSPPLPTADTVFPAPSAVPVAVNDIEERLAFQDDVDTLFPFESHASIRKNCEQRKLALVSAGLDDWLVAACGKCRAGRRQQWDAPATVLAVYAMHLYADTDAGHIGLETISAALRAYRHARAIRSRPALATEAV